MSTESELNLAPKRIKALKDLVNILCDEVNILRKINKKNEPFFALLAAKNNIHLHYREV